MQTISTSVAVDEKFISYEKTNAINQHTAQRLAKTMEVLIIVSIVSCLSYYCGMSTSSLPVVFLFILYSHSHN